MSGAMSDQLCFRESENPSIFHPNGLPHHNFNPCQEGPAFPQMRGYCQGHSTQFVPRVESGQSRRKRGTTVDGNNKRRVEMKERREKERASSGFIRHVFVMQPMQKAK